MSFTANFGVNYKKSYGTAPTILEHTVLDKGADKLGMYMFIKAASAISQYDLVIIDKTGAAVASATTTLVSTTPMILGISQIALATSEYGWVWIGFGGGTGSGIKVNVANAYTAGNRLYTTATAGQVGGTSTAGVIYGIVGLTTVASTGTMEVQAAQGIYSNQ